MLFHPKAFYGVLLPIDPEIDISVRKLYCKKFTPPKTKMSPQRDEHLNRKYIFQPLIFRRHVSFPGGKPKDQPRFNHPHINHIINKQTSGFTPSSHKLTKVVRDSCRFRSYCWWLKSCTTKDDDYPIIYRVLNIPGGAGFLPSTVSRGEKNGRENEMQWVWTEVTIILVTVRIMRSQNWRFGVWSSQTPAICIQTSF